MLACLACAYGCCDVELCTVAREAEEPFDPDVETVSGKS